MGIQYLTCAVIILMTYLGTPDVPDWQWQWHKQIEVTWPDCGKNAVVSHLHMYLQYHQGLILVLMSDKLFGATSWMLPSA